MSNVLTFTFTKADLEPLLADAAALSGKFASAFSSPQHFSGFFFQLLLLRGRDGGLDAFLMPCAMCSIPQPETVFVDYSIDLAKPDGSTAMVTGRFAKWFEAYQGWGKEISDVGLGKLKSPEDILRLSSASGESLQLQVDFLLVK